MKFKFYLIILIVTSAVNTLAMQSKVYRYEDDKVVVYTKKIDKATITTRKVKATGKIRCIKSETFSGGDIGFDEELDDHEFNVLECEYNLRQKERQS